MTSTESKNASAKPQSLRQTLVVLTLAAAGMSTLLTLLADAGHDQLWLLLAAQRMAPGLNPYGPQVFESNPPLAIWLSALVVGFGAMLHVPVTVALKLLVSGVAAATGATCAKLVRRLHPDWSSDRLWLLGIAFVLVFGAVPVRDFGQRDHILAMLVLPYLAGSALDLAGRRQSPLARLLIAVVAAVGLALKPHQVLIAIAVEVSFLMQRRRMRALEPAVFVASALAYLAAIRLFAPHYLSDVLPVLRETYWALGHLTFVQLVAQAGGLFVLLAAVVTLFRSWRKRSPLVLILLAAGVGATLAYTAQGTGWYYQQLPAISFLALAVTLQLFEFEWSICVPRWLPVPIAALTLLAFGLTAYFSDFQVTGSGIQQVQSTPDPSFFANLRPGAAVATLTTSVDDTAPAAFRYHVTLAQRYPHLWMLPAILRNESGPQPGRVISAEKLADLDRLQHRFMVEDLERWHPLLILVERCQDAAVHCQALEDRHDDLLAWFRRDPAFAAIFAHYRFVRSSGPYDAYVPEQPFPSWKIRSTP